MSYVDVPASEVNSTSQILSGFSPFYGAISADWIEESNSEDITVNFRDLRWEVPIRFAIQSNTNW